MMIRIVESVVAVAFPTRLAVVSSSAMAQTLTAERQLSATKAKEEEGPSGGTKLLDTRIFELKVRRDRAQSREAARYLRHSGAPTQKAGAVPPTRKARTPQAFEYFLSPLVNLISTRRGYVISHDMTSHLLTL